MVLTWRIDSIIVLLVSNKSSYSMYPIVILTLARQSLSKFLSAHLWKKVPAPNVPGTGGVGVGEGGGGEPL